MAERWRKTVTGTGKLRELVDQLTKVRDGLAEHREELLRQLEAAKAAQEKASG